MKLIYNIVLIAITSAMLFSCKKEYSCENCSTANKPPLSKAGPDQSIILPLDSILLDGSASIDPDGTIITWVWRKISGPASYSIIHFNSSRTMVKNLVAGIYAFELRVADNGNLSSADTLEILVNNPLQINRPPVAEAGPDQVIVLPQNSTMLNGNGSTDPDNNINSYFWSKISGPSSFTFGNSNSVQVQVSNLVQGMYQFELSVSDAGGLMDKDTIQVEVASQPQPCTNCELVFVTERDGNAEIYTSRADGSNQRRLTFSSAFDDEPVWSPDGTQIAFISNRGGDYDTYIMNADGSNVVRKTFSGSYAPAWSPDGTKLAYSSVSNGSSNIWVLDLQTNLHTLLFQSPGWEAEPSWSPDGTKLAIVSDWVAYDLAYDIYTINANGTAFTALTGSTPDNYDYFFPSWSPNSTKIAFHRWEATGFNPINYSIGIMNGDGSNITILSASASHSRPSWSPDGTKIIFTSITGAREDISRISADGSNAQVIITNARNAKWKH